MTKRIFQVSSDLFWGYTEEIDISLYTTLEELCNKMKEKMKQFFHSHNLFALEEKVDDVKLHIHAPIQDISYIYENIKPDEIIYLCDHCY